MRVDDTKNYKRDNPVSMTRRIQNTEIPWYHRTLGTIGREYTKETVQYTDSKEIKTMFHSMLCRFLSAFLKIY